MKKLLAALSIVLGLGFASAQQVSPATVSKSKTVKTVTPAKPMGSTKTVSKPAPAAKMKKDGTPDKRYKANKHLKKDGTVDKRYKK